MTREPPPTLPEDAFVGQHTSQPRSTPLSAAGASASLAAAAGLDRHHLHTLQTLDLDHHDRPMHDTMSSKPPSRPLPGQIQFRSNTIAPSPPALDACTEEDPYESPDEITYHTSPLGIGRSITSPISTTDIPSRPIPTTPTPGRSESLNSNYGLSISDSRSNSLTLHRKTSTASLKPISRTPSFKQAIANTIGSACSSAVPSPIITAMGDITPLPSPLLASDSPGPWRRMGARPPSRELMMPGLSPDSALVTSSGESIASALAHQAKRKTYATLQTSGGNGGAEHDANGDQRIHTRNRSVSEYVPDPMMIPKRQATVSGSHPRAEPGYNGAHDQHLRREPNLSSSRGIVPSAQPPTPPPSESSQSNDGSSGQYAVKKPTVEYFEAHGRNDKKLRRWRAIKQLGEGTFSRVMLATSKVTVDDDASESSQSEPDLRTLVAVKVCEHGPRGGASEMRIEMSLKRELEIMQSIRHPSLVHLKAWNIEPTRALLVLSYCPGGDLFDVATRHRELLTPPLLRRMFAELVGAVRYLHERHIVHRDIKLENVLVNVPPQQLSNPNQDWATYPESIITLTDLGLSRRVADDEKLETRCGSEDYAAPEVILGQPYDGRATDAWSMGVLLYALLESRLPFDPPPGASDALRMRSRTSHRIARVEWRWIEYAGDDGDHEGDESKFEAQGLKGAMEVTEGLLKRARSRWTLDKVAENEWISGAIKVEGGPRFREEVEGEEVL